jgi:hypothetical protein
MHLGMYESLHNHRRGLHPFDPGVMKRPLGYEDIEGQYSTSQFRFRVLENWSWRRKNQRYSTKIAMLTIPNHRRGTPRRSHALSCTPHRTALAYLHAGRAEAATLIIECFH